MAESDPIDTIDPSENPLELQPCQNLGLNDTIDPSENPLELQPFQNLGLGQLDIVRALTSTRANVQLHLHNTVQHSTVIKGDNVQGPKTDVNNSNIGTLLAPTGDCVLPGPSQSQAIAEPSIQDALPLVDGEEQEAGGVQLAASSNCTSVCQECLKLSVSNSQTNEPSLHLSAIMEGLAVSPSHDRSALKMNTLYEKEETKQDVDDFLPLLETTWKFQQARRNMKSIEKQLVHEASDFYKLGKLFASEDNFIHAVNSFYTAANLHRISNKRNNSVFDISDCVHQVQEVVEKMTKQPGLNVIVMDHVIPLMHEMKDYVQTTRGSSRDIMVENEAGCLLDIGNCYFYCDEHQRYANMNEYAIELMNKHFNDEAAKYYVYANCLSNAGVAYENLGEIEKSIEKYKMSLKAYEEANDWPSDEDKTDAIALTERNLKKTEAKLRK